MGCNTGYLATLGVLKIIETVCLVVSLATVESQMKIDALPQRHWRYKFHLSICIVSLVMVVLWFLLNLCVELFYQKCLKVCSGLVHFITGVILIVASAFLIDTLINQPQMHIRKTGAAFGIISGSLLIIEAFLHICIYNTDKNKNAKPYTLV